MGIIYYKYKNESFSLVNLADSFWSNNKP